LQHMRQDAWTERMRIDLVRPEQGIVARID
jgi:hypothetical protein